MRTTSDSNQASHPEHSDHDVEQQDLPLNSTVFRFKQLSVKGRRYMEQLLDIPTEPKRGVAPMKWEDFLKVMREMGFTYDPNTSDSSVRFNPPDPQDQPITFHKPYPDSTLYPVMVEEFGKKLKRYYGWSEGDFHQAFS